MGLIAAIVGLARARDDPRGGALLRRARRRDDAAEVLPRLRAADRQEDARRRRVRHRLDPARRLREDPRHEPPVAGRPGGDACSPEQRERLRAELARLDAAIERGDDDARARGARASCARSSARRAMWQELERALAPDAYWRQATWRRLVAIAAGPAVNLVFAFVLFTVLFMVASTRDTNVIGRVVHGHARGRRGHLHAGDRVLRVAGRAGHAEGDPGAHPRDRGTPVPARRPPPRPARDDRPGAREARRRARTGSGSRSSRARARASRSRRRASDARRG